jgi:hypothetical protein
MKSLRYTFLDVEKYFCSILPSIHYRPFMSPVKVYRIHPSVVVVCGRRSWLSSVVPFGLVWFGVKFYPKHAPVSVVEGSGV